MFRASLRGLKARGNLWLALFMILQCLQATAAKSKLKVVLAEPPSPVQWKFGMESVYFATAGRSQFLPGAGLAIFKTRSDEGWIFDAGVYVFPQEMSFLPFYFHPGYQFSSHWRASAIIGGAVLSGIGEGSGSSIPVLITSLEGEFIPLVTPHFQLGILAGLPAAYIVLVAPPYFGTHFQVNLNPRLSVNLIARTMIFHGVHLLASAGLQIGI